jgi:hypothetical protein
MFNTNTTNVWKESEYLEATKQNTILTLSSERGELFGDPYFGLTLKRFLFDQNNYVLRDVLADMIYTQLAIFIPQIKVQRNDIYVFQDRYKGQLLCRFSGINQLDFTSNTYELVLFREAQ